VLGRGDSAEGFAGWSGARTALEARLPKMPDWRLHDLRRAMATGMGELGVQPHIIEAAINRRSGHVGFRLYAGFHAADLKGFSVWAAKGRFDQANG
jgi:hypothetical protein